MQDDIVFESFSSLIEQSHGNSDSKIDSPEPQIAATAPDPQQAVGPPPSEFYSAIEAASMSGTDWDMRPHVLDKRTGQYILLDSGAQVTACPPDPGDQVDPSIALKAVNNARMKCYGYKTLEVHINK